MRYRLLSSLVALVTVGLIACRTAVKEAVAEAPEPAGAELGNDLSHDRSAEAGNATSITGKVVETMDAGGYTYVRVDDGPKKIWAAAPQFKVKVGDQVVLPQGMPMTDFYSKTLHRTFEVVYFVADVQVLGSDSARDKITAAHAAGHASAAAVDLSNIKKAPGGQTVAELFANKASLAGKEVVVRGRVVKFTPAVMGKNWIHVRDGTGDAGTNDLTVTTSTEAEVGKTVLVRGKLSTDKDYGAGYRYDIVIEDATVALE